MLSAKKQDVGHSELIVRHGPEKANCLVAFELANSNNLPLFYLNDVA